MNPTLCALLAEYNRWMNERLYDAAGKLTSEQVFEDRGAFFGSLFDTLNHIAVADLIWLHRLAPMPALAELKGLMAGLPQPKSLRERVAHSLPELAALRTTIDTIITRLATSLDAQALAQTLPYTNMAGQPHAKTLGLLLMHVFNHQTHHRGQASTLLFQAGVDVGVTDLITLIPNAG